MCSHVIWAFIFVFVNAVTVFDQFGHIDIKVFANAWVCILAEYQRSAGMLYEQVTDTGFYA